MKKQKQSYPRDRRYFSEEFRKARVREYETGKVSVSEICHVYQVSSTAVYKWIRKYSAHYQQGIVKVVESKSETKKRLALAHRISELEKLIGQQQVRIQYYEKLLEELESRYQIDFEKNSEWKSLIGSSQTDQPIN